MTAAEVALNGVREEARVGQRTTLDVLNAQQDLVNARVGVNPSQCNASPPFRPRKRRRASPLGARTRDPLQQVRDVWAACAPPTDADAELENLGTIASCRVFSAAVGH